MPEVVSLEVKEGDISFSVLHQATQLTLLRSIWPQIFHLWDLIKCVLAAYTSCIHSTLVIALFSLFCLSFDFLVALLIVLLLKIFWKHVIFLARFGTF